MKIELNGDNRDYLAFGNKIRTGKCKRCGKCCQKIDCKHLILDFDNGQPVYSCEFEKGLVKYRDHNISWLNKPLRCFLYPLGDELIEGCGYSWKEKQ